MAIANAKKCFLSTEYKQTCEGVAMTVLRRFMGKRDVF